MAMKMKPNPKGGMPKGMKPEHGTDRAIVKSKSNKGVYTPSASGAKAGARGKGSKGMKY